MHLNGTVSISKVFGGGEPPVIRIAIEDKSSGIAFVEATLDLAAFAAAVTGASDQPCTLEVRSLDRVGWTHEHKEEQVFVSDPRRPLEPSLSTEQLTVNARTAVSPFEVDGWKASSYSLKHIGNRHNILKRTEEGFLTTVHFHRYLPPTIKE